MFVNRSVIAPLRSSSSSRHHCPLVVGRADHRGSGRGTCAGPATTCTVRGVVGALLFVSRSSPCGPLSIRVKVVPPTVVFACKRSPVIGTRRRRAELRDRHGLRTSRRRADRSAVPSDVRTGARQRPSSSATSWVSGAARSNHGCARTVEQLLKPIVLIDQPSRHVERRPAGRGVRATSQVSVLR